MTLLPRTGTVRSARGPRARRRRGSPRRAFTMLDVIVGLVAAFVVAGAIGGVLILVSRAVPQTATATTPTTVSTARVADEIAAELRYATGFVEMTDSTVAFRVPDRDADGKEELIRFSWGGVVGDDVTREYNNSDPFTIATGVHDLTFEYRKRVQTTSGTTEQPVTSGEVLLASFSGWSGITPTITKRDLTAAGWIAQKINITAALPANATNLTITTIRFKAKKPLSGGGPYTVAVHLPDAAGSALPAATAVGTPASVPLSGLTTSYAWVPVTMSGVAFPTPVTTIIVVAKGTAAGTAHLQYLTSTSAPADAPVLHWTTDSGATWLPAASVESHNDAPFEVYGTYQTTQAQPANVDAYFMTAVDVSLDSGLGPSAIVRATARVLNEPEVPGP